MLENNIPSMQIFDKDSRDNPYLDYKVIIFQKFNLPLQSNRNYKHLVMKFLKMSGIMITFVYIINPLKYQIYVNQYQSKCQSFCEFLVRKKM